MTHGQIDIYRIRMVSSNYYGAQNASNVLMTAQKFGSTCEFPEVMKKWVFKGIPKEQQSFITSCLKFYPSVQNSICRLEPTRHVLGWKQNIWKRFSLLLHWGLRRELLAFLWYSVSRHTHTVQVFCFQMCWRSSWEKGAKFVQWNMTEIHGEVKHMEREVQSSVS